MSRRTSSNFNIKTLAQSTALVLFLIIVWSLGQNLVSLTKMDERLLVATEELDILKQENLKLQETASSYATGVHDEMVIRERLGLVKPEETIVILPKETVEIAAKVSDLSDEEAYVEVKPVWQQWIEVFF